MGADPLRSPGLSLAITQHPGLLRVHVQGPETFDNTVAYWQAIVAEVRRRKPAALLIVDELQGEPLSEDQWQALVNEVRGLGLESIPIAHVKPRGLREVEFCEIHAREAGFQSRVFADERAAELWLLFGEREG